MIFLSTSANTERTPDCLLFISALHRDLLEHLILRLAIRANCFIEPPKNPVQLRYTTIQNRIIGGKHMLKLEPIYIHAML